MKIAHDVALAPLTTLGIGGPAKRLVQVETDAELAEVLATDEPVLVMGGGSNLVIGDAGFPGTVVQLAGSDVTVQMIGDSILDGGKTAVTDGLPQWQTSIDALIGRSSDGANAVAQALPPLLAR